MARRDTRRLDEHTINVGGVEITVQMSPEDAEAQNATKGRASVDKEPTRKTPLAGDAELAAAEIKAEDAPANKAATAPANK